MSVVFFLISLNILFVSIQDEVINTRLETFFSGFTTIAWYFYFFAGGLLIIIWGLTFFNTMFLKKNIRDMKRFGGET